MVQSWTPGNLGPYPGCQGLRFCCSVLSGIWEFCSLIPVGTRETPNKCLCCRMFEAAETSKPPRHFSELPLYGQLLIISRCSCPPAFQSTRQTLYLPAFVSRERKDGRDGRWEWELGGKQQYPWLQQRSSEVLAGQGEQFCKSFACTSCEAKDCGR